MIKNYLKIAWRNLLKNKMYSVINIGGLAVGMAVALLIGLWIYGELNFNHEFKYHKKIAQVMQHFTQNGEVTSDISLPYLIGDVLKKNYADDLTNITMSSWNGSHALSFEDKVLMKSGTFFEPSVINMFSIKMLKGSGASLDDITSILLSETTARAYFGDADPLNKMMKIDNILSLKVTGVYKDLPQNSSFKDVQFIAPWATFVKDQSLEKYAGWRCNCFLSYVQINENGNFENVSAKIKSAKKSYADVSEANMNPELFLHPMDKWYLQSEFKNGKISGGRIEYIWLFGILGVFVLLLACINFMNLSTARSEKRAKEVGIRKAIGSVKNQLVFQFFSESILVAFLAFSVALLVTILFLPYFNNIAGKPISLPWNNLNFWMSCLLFTFITGGIAGSYPALYLSSFNPVKALKGSFKVGTYTGLLRKILVISQFSISIVMIIGTAIVFKQIQFVKNRPLGYSTDGLISLSMTTGDIHKYFNLVKKELNENNSVLSITESGSPTTAIWSTNSGFDWEGKDPKLAVDFPNIDVDYDYGKTIGWQFVAGRDFSKDYGTDSAAFIINEAAAKFMNFNKTNGQSAINETIKWDNNPFRVIGVVKNMLIESPYKEPRPMLYHLLHGNGNIVTIKLNPSLIARDALQKIETVFKKYNPSQPFEYSFVDADYANKFGDEERIGKLAAFFAILAIFISCLGLFGLASFVAEQRTKEIGVRKVMGATVANVWILLSKEFVMLVTISLLIAIPIAYYFMNNWIQKYAYRTTISWWIFIVAGILTLLITLLTVSFQAIKAAIANPVKSLRTE